MAASKPDLNAISAEVADQLLEQLNQDLKEGAASAGWPEHLSSALSVKKLNGSIFIDYPSSLSSQILDLEYGTSSIQPTAVMRKFKWRNQAKITELTVDAYAEWLTKTGGGVF